MRPQLDVDLFLAELTGGGDMDEFPADILDVGEPAPLDFQAGEAQAAVESVVGISGPPVPTVDSVIRQWRGKGLDISLDAEARSPIGRLTTWGSSISMTCKLHRKCARPYSAKRLATDNVLVQWLLDGRNLPSQSEHMALPKL